MKARIFNGQAHVSPISMQNDLKLWVKFRKSLDEACEPLAYCDVKRKQKVYDLPNTPRNNILSLYIK